MYKLSDRKKKYVLISKIQKLATPRFLTRNDANFYRSSENVSPVPYVLQMLQTRHQINTYCIIKNSSK